MYKNQDLSDVVDVTNWFVDEAFGANYPEGARDKILVISPPNGNYSFINPGWRYL